MKADITLEPPIAGILFFDIKHYSSLNLQELNIYHECVVKKLHNIAITKDGKEVDDYVYKNSWGDGIVLIHGDYIRLVSVGLEIRDYFKNREYERVIDDNETTRFELRGKGLLPRIAIHLGEFRQCDDGFKEGTICYGPALFLPARIEPITPAGRVWVTYRIKDFVEEKQKQNPGGREVRFFEQGWRKLAKGFGEKNIYEATWQGDPEPLRLDDEFDTKEHEPIDEDTARRIKALTGKNPLQEPVNVCCREPKKRCDVHDKSMRLTSDIKRNGETVGENLVVANSLRAIEIAAQNVWDKYEMTQVKEEDLRFLEEQICVFLKIFGDFDRDYEEGKYSDPCQPEQRPKNFLKHKTYGTIKDKYVEPFITGIVDFRRKCKRRKAVAVMNARQLADLIVRSVYAIKYNANQLVNHMEQLADMRNTVTNKAVKDGFNNFKSDNMVSHLKNTMSNFIGIESTNLLPANWAQ